MADTAQKKALITIESDVTGLTKAQKELALTIEGLKKLGVAGAESATIIETKLGKAFLKNNQVLQNQTQVVQLANNQYVQLKSTLAQAGNATGLVTKSLSATTAATNIFSKVTGIAGINIGQFAARAAVTSITFGAVGAALAGVTAIIGNSIKFMVDYEAALAQVGAVSEKVSKEQLNQLGSAALDLAAKFGVSFNQLGEALTTFAQLGLAPDAILQQLGPVLEFSLVSGRKAGEVVQDLVAIQVSYNLHAEDTVSILDNITEAQLKYSISTAQLSSALRRVGPAAGALGFSLQNTIGLVVALQEQTRKSGDEVGTALANIFSRLESVDVVGKLQGITNIPLFMKQAGDATSEFTGRVRPAQETLALLAQAFKNASDAEKAQIAVSLGGRQRFIDAAALLQNYKRSLEATSATILGFGSTGEASAKIMDTTKNSIERLNAEFLKTVNASRPAANALATFVTEGAIQLIQLYRKEIELVQAAATKLGSLFVGGDGKDHLKIASDAIQARQDELTKLKEIVNTQSGLIDLEKQYQALIGNAKTPEEKNKLIEERAKLGQINLQNIREQISKNGLDKSKIFDLSGINSADPVEQIKQLTNVQEKYVQGAKELNNLKKQNIIDDETNTEIILKMQKIEEEGVATGKSRLYILEQQLKASQESGKLADKEREKLERKIKLEKDSINNKFQLLKFQSTENTEIEKAISNGETDLQIQQRKVAYAAELAKFQQDSNVLAQEQLKTQELIAQKISQSSKEFQSSISSSLSSLLQGEGNFGSFFADINKKINAQRSNAIADNLVGTLIGSTGIGTAFGTGIQDILNFGKKDKSKEDVTKITDPILKAHQDGGQAVAEAITGAFDSVTKASPTFVNPVTGQTQRNPFAIPQDFTKNSPISGALAPLTYIGKGGMSPKAVEDFVAAGAKGTEEGVTAALSVANKKEKPIDSNSSSGGFLSGLTGLFKSGGNGLNLLGGIANAGFAGFNAISQFKQGNTAGGIGGLFSTAGSIASMFPGIGSTIGAGLNIIGGIVGLFRKPKRTVTNEEQTRETQVASKIEITNKKLDYVNRNLIALKQSFDSFILPESAYFSESRNIASQFSINAKRGLV